MLKIRLSGLKDEIEHMSGNEKRIEQPDKVADTVEASLSLII